MRYVDGFVTPVMKKSLLAYLRLTKDFESGVASLKAIAEK